MLIKKISAALLLGLQFFYLMVKSGFAMLWLIVKLRLKVKKSLHDRYISMEIPNVSETGLVALGCLVCLTPGTTVLNIDSRSNQMLLHILDAEQTDSAIQEIQHKFVPYILTLFSK
ncbi:Na+/H+ antiporter subunit E [Testudinibacter sp. P27/CKL/0425]